MGFGTDLQGKISHDALIRLQDTEIKLLETFKKCILLRIDSDKKYASSLSSVIQQAQKVDYTEFGPHCYTFKVWDKLWSETESFVKLLKGNNEDLSGKTVEKITSLISDKKSARKYYLDERNRLETEFTKIQEEAQKNKQEYCKLADRVKGDKARFEDLCVKGKTGGKFDDSKSKYYKNTVRLHKQHNDYLISLAEAREHQTGYLDHTLPSLLDYHQATQELYVQKSKEVFEDYYRYTNFSTTQFQDIYKSIDLSLEGFKPDREYTGEFITNYRSDPISPSLFEFDNKILDDYKGPLRNGVLAVDDLTIDPLRNKKSNFEEYIRKLQSDLEDKKKSLDAFQSQLDDAEKKLAQDRTNEVPKEFFHKKKSVELAKKDATEVECNFNKQTALLQYINEPLTALGDSPPPSALDLSNIAETTSQCQGQSEQPRITQQDDLVKSDTESKADEESILSGGSVAKRKKFSLGNILKKGSNDVKVRKDQESYEQAETDLSHNGPLSAGCVNENPDGPLSLEDQDYFHGVLPREEVQRLLVNDGDFLVRESRNKKSNEVQYVLSVHWQGYKHFIIQYGDGGWRFEGPSFPTIPELMTYQEHCNKPVTNKSQAILKAPVLREEWELKNDDVCLEMKIGNGNFGEVYKGVYRPTGIVVAVKTCKDTLSEDQRKKFLQEGRILKQYDHPNIVRFIGIAAQRQPVMIVMEYVSGGALLNFLREHGKNQNKKKLAYMCVDASNGMAYLECKNCIHRDLAARNCLIGDSNCVKISDFGMSREEEEYTLSGGMKQIPIKWTAPEALHFGRYTCLSDVWSFGVLVWEIFSLGTTPYKGMTNAEARDWIDSNHRMASPAGTPHEIYRIMKQCWEYDSDKRPHFNELYNRLKSIADSLV